jgi:hypothetical protein
MSWYNSESKSVDFSYESIMQLLKGFGRIVLYSLVKAR